MNLERMLIGYKPKGFQMEKSKRAYWNRLDLSITGGHTTAIVKHWTGREDTLQLCFRYHLRATNISYNAHEIIVSTL